jgi:hydrogenase nickel incorporation protein HypA/HybF
MHEVSLCESILDIIREQAQQHGATRVKCVRLTIGEMAGVVEDSMRFAFEVVTKGTLAEGSELLIESVPLTAMCRTCGKTFHIVGYAFSCKHCESPEITVVSGRELQIEDIELEA